MLRDLTVCVTGGLALALVQTFLSGLTCNAAWLDGADMVCVLLLGPGDWAGRALGLATPSFTGERWSSAVIGGLDKKCDWGTAAATCWVSAGLGRRP